MAGVEATVVETAVVSFAFVVVAAVVTLTVAGSVLSSYIVPVSYTHLTLPTNSRV